MFDVLFMLLFFSCGFLVVYHHLLFPLWLAQYKKRHPMPVTPAPERGYLSSEQDQQLPDISLIIPAYNEAAVINDKINNLGTLDYPAEKLRIVLICDGCSDDTAELARLAHRRPENQHLQLELVEQRNNRGKVATLNSAISAAQSDIVALSDTSALISTDALLIAAQHFQNQQIAVVAGSYHLLNPGSEGEKLYWRYQSNIKKGEAALGAPLGVHGAFYLFRRDLFQPLEADTINDDFILPMRMVAQGYKAVYEPEIMALELEKASTKQDQQRRLRIAAGNLQQTLRLRNLLNPRYSGVAFAFASGKALRVLMPIILLTLLASNLMLLSAHWLFTLLGLAQLGLYLLSLCVHLLPVLQRSRLLQTLYYLIGGYTSALLGSIHYLRGRSDMLWWQSIQAKEKLS